MNRRYWADLGERVATTYVVSFTGLLLAHGTHLLTLSSVRAAALAAIPACGSVVVGLLGGRVGVPGTASLLPKPKEPASGGQ